MGKSSKNIQKRWVEWGKHGKTIHKWCVWWENHLQMVGLMGETYPRMGLGSCIGNKSSING